MLSIAVLLGCTKPEPPDVGIIPQPNSIEKKEGVFEITSKTVVYASPSPATRKTADKFLAFMKNTYGMELQMTGSLKDGDILFVRTLKKGIRKGAYTMSVTKRKIEIKSASDAGIFYGYQTMKQLLTPRSYFKYPAIPCMEITDYPEFEWRGLMLDVSRHFIPKDSVKKILDILAMHKMNKLHWHLTDGIGWRIQIDKYPFLTEKGAWRVIKPGLKPWEQFEACYKNDPRGAYGGFYTKDDVREIVLYAAERYIDVIPEIEMPGHSEAALQCYPEYVCKGLKNNGVYCAGNDGTFEFLQNILFEVMDMFPSKFIHIGGDEVSKANWEKCPLCKKRMKEYGLKNTNELQSYFIKRIERFIHANGRKLIGWDEIIEGGLPARAAVMSWRGMKGGIEAANWGHDVVMTPGSPLYFDHSQGRSAYEPESWGGYNNLMKVYAFYPVPPNIDIDRRFHILGAQANLWTEQIKNLWHAEYMILPRLSALSEVDWTKLQSKNKEYFIKKIDVQFDRFAELGYNFAWSSLTPYDEIVYDKQKKAFVLTLKNELGIHEIRYTLDGTKPNNNSTLYTKPIIFDKPVKLYALCFRKGKAVGYPLIKEFSTQFSDRCSVKYKYPYDDSYSGGGDKALCDNQFAINRGDDKHWQGFKKNDFDAVIDLGDEVEISYIALNFFQHISATSCMLPKQVKIMISEDGKNYKTVFDKSYEIDTNRSPIIKRVKVEFPKQKVEYIHIIAENIGVLPDWHPRHGQDAWVVVDEVTVK